MLASVEDVIRVLRQPSTEELTEQLTPLLEAVDAWIHASFDANWDQTPNSVVTETKYNVAQDEMMKVGDVNPTNVSIKIYPSSPTDFISDLFDNSSEFDLQPGGLIRLTSSIFVSIPGFPNAWARRFKRQFHKVEITYTASGTIPTPVREAVALITAATYTQQETDISNIKSERIGDYSYTIEGTYRGGNMGFVIPPRAQQFLAPYLRGLRARAV